MTKHLPLLLVLSLAACGSPDIDDYREDRQQLTDDLANCNARFMAGKGDVAECRRLKEMYDALDAEDKANGTGKYSPEAKAAREAERERSREARRKAQEEMNEAIKKNLEEVDLDIKWGK